MENKTANVIPFPKEATSRKSMAPAVIFAILRDNRRTFKREEIRNLLRTVWGIDLDRKAVSRILNTLSIAEVGIVVSSKGVYYDPNEDFSRLRNGLDALREIKDTEVNLPRPYCIVDGLGTDNLLIRKQWR